MRLYILDYDRGSNRYRTAAVFEKNGSGALDLLQTNSLKRIWAPNDINRMWPGKVINTRERVNGQVIDMLKQELLGVPEGADGILVYRIESGKIAASSIMRRDPVAEDPDVAATLADVHRFINQARIGKDPELATGSNVISCPYRFVRIEETGLYAPV
ncbi:MAG: hypothetical protein HY515_01860 [Candidatus Aenigmarchaeota archaeon]|nr:hypothetical protein [Candidatus Aenigmarchaeota archaeon]